MKALTQTFLAGVAGALTVGVLMAAAGPLGLRDDGIQFPDGTLQTTAATSDARRVFYLTIKRFRGFPSETSSPLEGCASGFHMASIWEILDVSNLRYASDEEANGDAFRLEDSGQGPPGVQWGWIRTGYFPNSLQIEGQANCDVWSQWTSDSFGTAVSLETDWRTIPGSPNLPWSSFAFPCEVELPVWCVEG